MWNPFSWKKEHETKQSAGFIRLLERYTSRSKHRFDIKNSVDQIFMQHMAQVAKFVDDKDYPSEFDRFFEAFKNSVVLKLKSGETTYSNKVDVAEQEIKTQFGILSSKIHTHINKLSEAEHSLSNWTNNLNMNLNYSDEIMVKTQDLKNHLHALKQNVDTLERSSVKTYFSKIHPSVEWNWVISELINKIKAILVNDLNNVRTSSRDVASTLTRWRNTARQKGIKPTNVELEVY